MLQQVCKESLTVLWYLKRSYPVCKFDRSDGWKAHRISNSPKGTWLVWKEMIDFIVRHKENEDLADRITAIEQWLNEQRQKNRS
jgi:hypothetical protein